MGIGVVGHGPQRGVAGGEGFRVAAGGLQQPGSIRVIKRQHRVGRRFAPNCLVQVAQRDLDLVRGQVLALWYTSARPRYNGARSGRSVMAWVNCSTASSGFPCCRSTWAKPA